MMEYLGSLIEADVITAEAKICENASIPNDEGTTRWSEVLKDLDDVFYIAKPNNGWGGYTYEQMIAGVINVEEVTPVLPDPED